MNKHTPSHVHTYTTTHPFSPLLSLPAATSDSFQCTDRFPLKYRLSEILSLEALFIAMGARSILGQAA